MITNQQSTHNNLNVGQHIDNTLSQLPLKWQWRSTISTGIGFSSKAVWSRAARRHVGKASGEDMDEEDMALGFMIQIEQLPGGQPGSKATARWLKGHDSVLFESFCGMLKRKIEEKNSMP